MPRDRDYPDRIINAPSVELSALVELLVKTPRSWDVSFHDTRPGVYTGKDYPNRYEDNFKMGDNAYDVFSIWLSPDDSIAPGTLQISSVYDFARDAVDGYRVEYSSPPVSGDEKNRYYEDAETWYDPFEIEHDVDTDALTGTLNTFDEAVSLAIELMKNKDDLHPEEAAKHQARTESTRREEFFGAPESEA